MHIYRARELANCMALLKIAKMGHPVLRRRAEPVADPAASAIGRLVADMVETMIDAGGVGLAAPQVHESRRILVYRLPVDVATTESNGAGHDETVNRQAALINPELDPLDDRIVIGLEGCLSIPGLRGMVPRYAGVRYRGFDADGQAVFGEAHGFHARVLQHEVDHLDGVLFLDRMADLASLAFESELHHLVEEKERA